ncbi:transcription termination/antitermination protein NusA-like isoform X3 [Papaver somniferum]|uniref:transcription termination/antitermination protein NusA-like isoform X3 n=1 Tax=Papaver somniferum TaxID=3469 RepID=UPI000E6F4AC5|nr:transcription termination/antitermination protein NusA-like isoform X3 [Papaver somniferum]
MAEELTLDLEELHHLQSIAKRPRILSMISSEIRNLETEKQLLKDVDSQPTAQTSDPSPTPAAPTPTPTPAAPAPTPTPAAPAPTLLAKGLSIPALNYATLSSFSWDQDDEKVKLKPGLEKERDPMAGIMDLMKNMYEEGDEDMKRTIAKAWTDARSGKSADPMNAYR